MQLGNTISEALRLIGVTQDRVELYLGVPCNCPERIQRLNQLGAWAWRVVNGRTVDALKYLETLIRSETNVSDESIENNRFHL